MMAELRIATPRNMRGQYDPIFATRTNWLRSRAPEFTLLQFAIADHRRARHRNGGGGMKANSGHDLHCVQFCPRCPVRLTGGRVVTGTISLAGC